MLRGFGDLRHNCAVFTDLKIPADRRPMSQSEARIVAIGTTIFTLMMLFAIFEEYSVERLSFLFILLWWVPMLVLHEAGHAIMARWLGWQVREIVIGFGRDVAQWRMGATRVRVKLVPIEGYIVPAPTDRTDIRFKSALIYAAGPGIELILLGILLVTFGWDGVFGSSNDVEHVALKSLAFVIVLGAGFNLLPFASDGAVSDGLGIITSMFMSEPYIQLRLVTLELREIHRLIDTGETEQALSLANSLVKRFPDNDVLQLMLVRCLSAKGDVDRARETARQKLASSDLAAADQFAWLREQAQIELDAPDPAWLVLDLAVQEAIRITPTSSAILTIKGASLALRGQFEAGGNLLAEAWRRNDGSVKDAEILAYLTIAARKIRDNDAATHFGTVFSQVNRSAALARRVSDICGPDV